MIQTSPRARTMECRGGHVRSTANCKITLAKSPRVQERSRSIGHFEYWRVFASYLRPNLKNRQKGGENQAGENCDYCESLLSAFALVVEDCAARLLIHTARKELGIFPKKADQIHEKCRAPTRS